MKNRRATRSFGFDALERRECLSALNVFPAATEPVPRYDSTYEQRHLAALAAVESGQASNVVFLGDSMIQYFQTASGAPIWNWRIAPLGVANFGVTGDTTNNLLWRVENGALGGQPKVAVVEVGTDNLNPNIGESVAQTVEGIAAVVAEIHLLSPKTEILLNGLFPRGTPTDPLRTEIAQINSVLGSLAPVLQVHYMNPGPQLLSRQGTLLSTTVDLIHPNLRGYELWASTLVGPIKQLLQSYPRIN
jgi:lysophospholipase L1-like esterase